MTSAFDKTSAGLPENLQVRLPNGGLGAAEARIKGGFGVA